MAKKKNKDKEKIAKLKALLLLTDPAVSNIVAGELQRKQWNAYRREFGDEGI